jgi:O-antigen/teichoic acid export membrane protein
MAGSNIVLIFFSYPIYLQYLGLELYGLWATFSVLLVFGQMGQFGINQSIIKFVAESIKLNDDGKKAAEYITGAFVILISISILFVCIIVIFKESFINLLNLPDQYIGLVSNLFLWFSLLVPTVMFVQFLKGILMGLGKVELSNYLFIIGDTTKIGLSIFLLTKGYQIFSLYWGWLLSNLLLIIIYIILSKQNLKKVFVFQRGVYDRTAELFHYGKYLVGNTILSLAFIPMITILITRNIGLLEVTYFTISHKIVNSIKVLFVKGLQGIIPHVAKLNDNLHGIKRVETVKSLKSIHRKSLLFIGAIGCPIIIIFYWFANPILKYWLGDSFHILFLFSTRVLLISLFIEIAILPIWHIFLGINKPNYNFISAVIKYIFFILFILILIIKNMLSYRLILLYAVVSTLFFTLFLVIKYFQTIKTIQNN